MNSSDGVSDLLGASRFAQHARVGDCVLSMDEEGVLVADRIVKVSLLIKFYIFSPGIFKNMFSVIGMDNTKDTEKLLH